MQFYVGCPIWAYKGWVNSFYPPGARPGDYLKVYAQQLNTVEGNTTFYAVPSPATVDRWVEETPPAFRLCPKLPRSISHAGKLMDHLEETERFLSVMGRLGERLGPYFLQLPPSYPPGMLKDLDAFLARWPGETPLAVEVRHLAWFEPRHHETLQTLLASRQMARVIIDTRPIRDLAGDAILKGSVYERLLQARERKPNPPLVLEPTASFTFLRYIGHPDLERNGPFLREWAGHLAGWLRQGLDAYVFCHCPDERQDPTLCRELHREVSGKIPIPPLPPDRSEPRARQESLFS